MSNWTEGNGEWRSKKDTPDETLFGSDHDHLHHYNDRNTGERTAHAKHGGEYSEKVGSSAFGNLMRAFKGWDNESDTNSCRSDCAPHSNDD